MCMCVVCVYVCVCVFLRVIRCNNNPLHLQSVDGKRSEYERKKERKKEKRKKMKERKKERKKLSVTTIISSLQLVKGKLQMNFYFFYFSLMSIDFLLMKQRSATRERQFEQHNILRNYDKYITTFFKVPDS